MNFSDERYVRIYTRDTITWKLLGWEGRFFLTMLLRKVDRAGTLELEAGLEGLAVLCDMPEDITERGLAACLKRGSVVQDGNRLLIPNFLTAQEAKQSDAQRQREYRARQKSSTQTDNASREVTSGHDLLRNDVTNERNITPNYALPAVPSLPAEPKEQSRIGSNFKPKELWDALAAKAGGKLRLERKSSDSDIGVPYTQFSNFTHAAGGLAKRDPPYAIEHYELCGDWIAAGGLDWHAKHNTPPWKRVCDRLEECLSAAEEWDKDGRKPVGKEKPPPSWKADPTVGAQRDPDKALKEAREWMDR
jgi:hypothetical protein